MALIKLVFLVHKNLITQDHLTQRLLISPEGLQREVKRNLETLMK